MRLDVNRNKDTFSRQKGFFKRTSLNVLTSHYGTIETSRIKLVSEGWG